MGRPNVICIVRVIFSGCGQFVNDIKFCQGDQVVCRITLANPRLPWDRVEVTVIRFDCFKIILRF